MNFIPLSWAAGINGSQTTTLIDRGVSHNATSNWFPVCWKGRFTLVNVRLLLILVLCKCSVRNGSVTLIYESLMRQNVALLWNMPYNLHHSGNFGETSRIFSNMIRLNLDPSGLTKDTGFVCRRLCHACCGLTDAFFFFISITLSHVVGIPLVIVPQFPHVHLSSIAYPSSIMFFPVHSVTVAMPVVLRPPQLHLPPPHFSAGCLVHLSVC